MAGSDQFFEDEESLTGEEPAPGASRAAGKAGGAGSPGGTRRSGGSVQGAGSSGTGTATRRPPSFLMVVAIAVVALILGFALGYFTALNTWSSKLEQDVGGSATTRASTSSGNSSTVNEETGLPEGHPDLASLMNADGTINEEKLAEYKAQLSASKDASAAVDASASAQDGE